MHVHFVFVTKYRRNVFTKEVLDDLKIFFEKVCLDFESELVEFDGEDDHVHLLVNYPPKVSVSALVNSLKGVSSRMIRKRITLRSKRNSGAVRSGRPVILQGAVVVRRLRSFGSILSSNKLRRSPQNGFAVALFILALNGEVFRAPR